MEVEDNKPVIEGEVATQPQPQVSEKAPRVLLEFLVYGVEADKKKIKKMLDAIQEQMFKARKGKLVRALWYIDKGEKTPEEKKQWLVENSKAKYYVFTPENRYVVPKDYVKEMLLRIKRLEDSIVSARSAGIVVSKNKPDLNENQVESVEPKPELKVVD